MARDTVGDIQIGEGLVRQAQDLKPSASESST